VKKLDNDLSLYIHIPFCVKKCLYCDFPSYSGCENIFDDYTLKLVEELKEGSRIYEGKKIKSVFVGGGTPTVLSGRNLGKIMDTVLNRFDVDSSAEITCEANPGTLDEIKLKDMYSMNINRLSMGLQAWQDRLLKVLGRIHNRETFVNDVKLAKEIGFKNINCDIMFALPTQTMDDWQQTLENVIKLDIQHISAYSLIVEDGTPFKKMFDSGVYRLTDEVTDRKMYYLAKEMLKDYGYNQYEISNFAKEGYESYHNSVYWKTKEYIGFGLGSHSYFDSKRFHNTYDMKKYMSFLNSSDIKEDIEYLRENDKISEFMFMGLRMTNGISENEFEKRFGSSVNSIYKDVIEELIYEKLIVRNDGRIFLTDRGMDISNFVFEKFLL